MYRSLLALLLFSTIAYSQQINFDRLGKEKFFQYGGGVSTNTIFYEGSGQRESLTYFLSGNLNFNFAGLYQIPLSFAYSNQGFDTPNPFNFNRLSLSPSYKWIKVHLGSVNMSFTPYTLNGHQFNGVGLELTPGNRFKVAMMYGRFLKATEYNPEEPNALVAYRRVGYGIKSSYKFKKALLGISLFKAKDDSKSLETVIPLEVGILPGNNTAISFNTQMDLWDKAKLQLEYAVSGVTEDIRLQGNEANRSFFSFLVDGNISTQYYSAVKANVDYPAGDGSLGLGYERIDPNYRTFGAYYFNNDLENITVNGNQSIFNNTLGIALNVGLQRDNLDNTKVAEMKRLVSSINLNYSTSDKVNINGSYSNFQSFTNIRDQFDYINQVDQLDNLDTLNYRQISQNANLGVNYQLKNGESNRQSLNLNLTYQQSKNEQEGQEAAGGDNVFYNGTVALSMGYPEHSLVITPAAHVSYNTVGITETQWILGPTLGVAKQFLEKKLRTHVSASYNSTISYQETNRSNLNFRLGGNYTPHKDHLLQCNFLALMRSGTIHGGSDFTLTLGYTYNFSNGTAKKRSDSDDLEERKQVSSLKFRHQGISYEGTRDKILHQLRDRLQTSFEEIADTAILEQLSISLKALEAEQNDQVFKLKAIGFLDALAEYIQSQEN